MFLLPDFKIPITRLFSRNGCELFVKREDLVHPEISGNKYWKLFYSVNTYLSENPSSKLLVTFGGAYSNHIAATAAAGKIFNVPTMGIVRGEELDTLPLNSTLRQAEADGMTLRFVSRTDYRNINKLTAELQQEFPNALIIPEGGTTPGAVEGVRHMLDERTADFDYLCSAVGTGGTLAGLSRFSNEGQKVIGFNVVADSSLRERIASLSGKTNFDLVEAAFGGYGHIMPEVVSFVNGFYSEYNLPLDPIYTGKMMMKLLQLLDEGYFPSRSRILAFHTGGLQGVAGANEWLQNKNRELIKHI